MNIDQVNAGSLARGGVVGSVLPQRATGPTEPMPVSVMQQIAIEANQNALDLGELVYRFDALIERLSSSGGAPGQQSAVQSPPNGLLGELRFSADLTRERANDLRARLDQLAVLIG
jgi:hypothetical protein